MKKEERRKKKAVCLADLVINMEQFNKTEHGIIIHGDCRKLMPDLIQFDLLVTDPPYGLGPRNNYHRTHKSRGKLCPSTDYGDYAWDARKPSKRVFKDLLKSCRAHAIFGGNYFADRLPVSSCWIVWDKENSGCFADCELIWTSSATAVRKITVRWGGCMQYDMANKERRLHPTQKPVPVYKYLINKFSKPGDVIFDPFAGSGTAAIAAIRTGRKYVLIEKDERYYQMAVQRVADELAQADFIRDEPIDEQEELAI